MLYFHLHFRARSPDPEINHSGFQDRQPALFFWVIKQNIRNTLIDSGGRQDPAKAVNHELFRMHIVQINSRFRDQRRCSLN